MRRGVKDRAARPGRRARPAARPPRKRCSREWATTPRPAGRRAPAPAPRSAACPRLRPQNAGLSHPQGHGRHGRSGCPHARTHARTCRPADAALPAMRLERSIPPPSTPEHPSPRLAALCASSGAGREDECVGRRGSAGARAAQRSAVRRLGGALPNALAPEAEPETSNDPKSDTVDVFCKCQPSIRLWDQCRLG